MDPARRWTIEEAALRWPTGPLIQLVQEPGDKDAGAEEPAPTSSPEAAQPVPPSSHPSTRVANTPKSKASPDEVPAVVVAHASAVESEKASESTSTAELEGSLVHQPASDIQSGFDYKMFQDDLGTTYCFTKDAPILDSGPGVVVIEVKHSRTEVPFAITASTRRTGSIELEVLKRLQDYVEGSGKKVPGSRNVLQLVESVVTDSTICEWFNLVRALSVD